MKSELQAFEDLAECSANESAPRFPSVSERVMHSIARRGSTNAAMEQRALVVGGLALCVAGMAVLAFVSRSSLEDFLPLFIPHDLPHL